MALVTSNVEEGGTQSGFPESSVVSPPPRPGEKTVALAPNQLPTAAAAVPHASGEAIDVRGRFRIEAALAQGGMGMIYRAWDGRLNRAVALKVLLAAHEGNRTLGQRFTDEARLTASLEHPGVVPVFEIGRCVDRRPFFAMGLIEGETLAQILDRREGLSDLPKLLRCFEQVCQTAGHAHSRGIIHRDLKPENVMIGGFGTVKVIDWGIALRLNAEESADEELICGTPAYLPPEQAVGEFDRIDERADVFSLGGILCEILTGHPPYRGESQEEVMEQAGEARLGDAFARLENCGADHELVRLAKHCLSADPASRPRTAVEVERVLKDYLESGLRRIERDQMRFFELSLEMFCIAGLDGYFRQINSNFPRNLGFTEEELRSRPFIDFVHPDDVVATAEAVANLGSGHQVVGFTNRYRHVDGYYVRLEWSARAIPDEGVIYAVARFL